MAKNFDRWNKVKQDIDGQIDLVLFHEREIWWCALGVNVGFEQDGKHDNFERPVLILKKFNRDVALVVPLTTKHKNNKYYYKLEGRDSFVVLSQIKLISVKRLIRKAGSVSRRELEEVITLTKSLF